MRRLIAGLLLIILLVPLLTDAQVTNPSGGGATVRLDNLASVAVNTALLPATAGALDLGSAALPWGALYTSYAAFEEIGLIGGGINTDTVNLNLVSVAGDILLQSGGHVRIFGQPPTVSLCGTAPSLAIGADQAGKVTAGTAAPTSCTLTFAVAWTAAPACVCNDETAIVVCQAVSTTTTLTMNTVASMDSHTLSYICMQGI